MYAYYNNNLVKYSYTQVSEKTIPTRAPVTYNTVNNQASRGNVTEKRVEGVRWENDFMVTGWPTTLTVTDTGLELVSWGLSAYKGTLYFDETEVQSMYVSVGNISAYAGFDVVKGGGFDLSANVAEIGFDGRVIDANVEFLTIGISYMYKDGKVKFGMGYGWVGFSISVNIPEAMKVFYGG